MIIEINYSTWLGVEFNHAYISEKSWLDTSQTLIYHEEKLKEVAESCFLSISKQFSLFSWLPVCGSVA